MAYTSVAVVGAGGNLGKVFMQALLESTEPIFNITVLSRPSSHYEAPAEHVKVVKHDLTDHAGISECLRGVDAVIFMQSLDNEFVTVCKAIIEAAITAGVKMVMPADFGSKDTPIFTQVVAAKPPVRDFVQEKAKEGKITYTLIKNGGYWDMPLNTAVGVDYKAKKVTLFNDGAQKFHTTCYATVSRAVVNVLRSPADFSNKTIYIHDFYTSQREILEIVESETRTKFEVTTMDMEEVGNTSLAALARGDYSLQHIYGGLRAAVWGKEAAADWDVNDDSERLGLEKKDLRAEIKKKMEAGM